MKKNFAWGALAIATATAIGGSYQILAQSTTTPQVERQGSKDSKPLLQETKSLTTRYVDGDMRVIAPNASLRQGPSQVNTIQQGVSFQPVLSNLPNGPGGHETHVYQTAIRSNHYESVIIEDGKVKVVSSNEPMDEETRAKSNEARKQLEDAYRTFRSDDSSDQDRAKARTTLSSYLTAQFDHDQEMRRKQIKSLEEEMDKLKKQISKREESKEKLVELRLTLLENDANGLAFPPAFNQIPGANGPGFGPPGAIFGVPGTSPGTTYSVQTFNMPNSAPGGFGLSPSHQPAGVAPGLPANILPIPPAPPAHDPNTRYRSK